MNYTQIAADTFDRADGAMGANWLSVNPDNGSSSFINGNRAVCNNSGTLAAGAGSMHRWAGTGTFSADQRVIIVIDLLANLSNAYYCGAAVRMSSDLNAGRDLYGFIIENDSSSSYTTRVFKIVNGTYTSLTSTSVAWVNTDTAWFDVVSTGLSVYRNGSIISALTTTDSALATGVPGFVIGGQTANPALNSWEAGDLTAAAGGGPLTGGLTRSILTESRVII